MEAIATVAGAVIGFIGVIVGVGARMLIARMKDIDKKHAELATAFNDHREEVPKTYVTKADLRDTLDSIKSGIDRVTDYIMRGNDGR